MSEPTTEAGRRLADGLMDCPCGHPTGTSRILAIEAEAHAGVEARIPEAVRAAWQAHVAAMQLEYETGMEIFDKEAIPDALADAVLAIVRGAK